MGQRLNLEFEIDGDIIGNVYFHWGAYTECALKYLERIGSVLEESEIMKELIQADTDLEKQKWIVQLCEKAGFSGLNEDSHMYLSAQFPNESFVQATNRNEGLVSITQKDIDSTIEWQEGTSSVFIDSTTGDYALSNDLIWEIGTEEETLFVDADVADEEEFEESEGPLSDLPNIEIFEMIDFGDMNINEVRTVIDKFNKVIKGHYFKVKDTYYTYVC